jgi:hypothetical protein
MEEQFTVLGDQIKALTTQLSNMGDHNENGSRDPFTEHGTHRRQHRAQAHANQWENKFKLNIPEFQGWLQPEEFLVIEKIDKNKVLREAVEIWSQSVEEEEDGLIDWVSPPIYDTYLDKEVSSIYQVDFLGVYAILSKTFNQSCDEIYGVEMNFLSKSEGMFVSSLGILIACGKDKAKQEHGTPTRQGEVQGLQYKCGGVLINKAITFIIGCGLVVILRRGDWNELTGHSKDRGKYSSNLGRILSNLGRMM